MNRNIEEFVNEHVALTRRYFLGCGVAGVMAASSPRMFAGERQRDPRLQASLDALETWLTHPDEFRDVSRGNPKPHSLPDEARKMAGLTRDTWQLELLSDPKHPAKLRAPMKKADGTALNFNGLMELAKTRAVRFPKAMTCLNIGCPLGNGIWEGVPLRDVLWLTEPREDLRRVFYHGFHNNDPKQLFQSSLPVGRVLEDPFDLPPVILCYKLNGQWLTPERGGPVRLVFPEGYGFKSIKWLSQIFLSNLSHANDTYAEQNNDVDSPMKTFCATISLPSKVKANEAIPVTGYAQVGISGLKKVQVWVHRDSEELPSNDRYFASAPWQDAEILAVPTDLGGGLPGDRIPADTMGFDDVTGQPKVWPIRCSMVHWAVNLKGLAPGEYTFRCRTIDDKGIAQPLPRPFRKSGHSAIEQLSLQVEA